MKFYSQSESHSITQEGAILLRSNHSLFFFISFFFHNLFLWFGSTVVLRGLFSLGRRPIVSLISMRRLFSKRKHDCFIFFFFFFFSFLLFDVLLFTDSSVSNVRLLRVYEIVNESFRKEMHEILTFSENRETPCSLTSCETVARWLFLKFFQFLLFVVYVSRNSSTKWWYKSFFPVVIRITGMVRATMISKLFSTWVVRGFWKSIFPLWRQLTRIFSTST